MSKADGGFNRAKNLSKQELSEIAKKGARARWMPKATHQGVLKIMGKELPCVVLEDGRRIINQTSLFVAFDRSRKGRRNTENSLLNLPSILDPIGLKPFITPDVLERTKSIEYMSINGSSTTGYSAEIIPIVCEIYLNAHKNGALTHAQVRTAEISEMLIRSLAHVGIIGLIDEATGYQQIRPRDALEAYLNKILSKELATWCKRFPDEFYSNIYKLKNWPEFSTSKNKYSCVGMYTNDIVYSRLGEDVLKELKERTPNTSKTKMHQWLSLDTGHPLLSDHMKSLITLQRLALAQGHKWNKFLEMVNLTLPKKEHALIEEGNP